MALVTALSLAPGSAKAMFSGDDAAPPAKKHFRKMAKDLKLTEQQQQQIKDIFAKNRAVAQTLMQQLVTERRALRGLIQADTIDEAGIRAQAAKVAAIQADQAVNRAHLAKEIRGVLTPDQVAKLKAKQAERDKKADERAAHFGKRTQKEQ
jgi:protein CpxP